MRPARASSARMGLGTNSRRSYPRRAPGTRVLVSLLVHETLWQVQPDLEPKYGNNSRTAEHRYFIFEVTFP